MKENNISNYFSFTDYGFFPMYYFFNANENNLNKDFIKKDQIQIYLNASKKDEKYKIYNKIHKKTIFERIYSKKINLSIQANKCPSNTLINKLNFSVNKAKNLSLEEYIENIRINYEKNHNNFK